MKLCRIRTILGRNAACMCVWSLAIGTSANIYFRACAWCASLVRSGWKSITWLLSVAFNVSRLEREVFPSPCPESPIQLQLSYNGYLTYLMFAARNLPLDSSLKFSICCSSYIAVAPSPCCTIYGSPSAAAMIEPELGPLRLMQASSFTLMLSRISCWFVQISFACQPSCGCNLYLYK